MNSPLLKKSLIKYAYAFEFVENVKKSAPEEFITVF
jgi:hypothetical protein